MKRIKLTPQEKQIEKDLIEDNFVPVNSAEFNAISESIARRKKDAVLNIRINSYDLKSIKHKANKLGIKYQSFIAEVLHKVAL